jgi:Fur family transcriptional regulator, peroxide stress response regulator
MEIHSPQGTGVLNPAKQMADAQKRYDELIAKLREQGYRLTAQRLALVRLVAASEGHPNAAQLYNRLKPEFPTVSPATVYKLLALLKELGEVFEIDLRDDSHYDGNRPYPHPHLICMRCHQIIDGAIDLDPGLIRQLERKSGYQIVRHQLAFYGLCPACQKDE